MTRTRELQATSLDELRELARAIGRDPAVAGLLVYVPSLDAGWVACEGVRDTFRELRAAGKQVACYVSEGGGNRELYVALSASRVYMAPYSAFGPLGLAARPLYIRPLLDRIGITVEAQAAGEYKSAAEPALRDSMSEPAREQLEALLAAMHASLTETLHERGLSTEQVSRLFERGLVHAKDALEAGLVDGVLYEDELYAQLGCAAPDELDTSAKPEQPKPLRAVDAARYLGWHRARIWKPLRRKPCIAVVPLQGTIASEPGSRFGQALRPRALTILVRKLARDPSVRAVMLYIDSPGGSALASELMHRELRRLAAKKPTVACFGEVAASGGYYLACACQKIIAQPLCVTGSIGVVSAKVHAGGLLERLGIRPQLVRTAPSADMLSIARGLSLEEEALLRAHAAEVYERFLAVVAEGRGRSVPDVEPLARGRVWSGRDAHARGLVDVLGGVERGLAEARNLIADVPEPERDAIEPRVYRLKSGAGFSLGDGLRALLLAPWSGLLSDLATLDALRREPVSYYAPFASPLE